MARTALPLKAVIADITVGSTEAAQVIDASEAPVVDRGLYLEAASGNNADVYVGLADVSNAKKLRVLRPGSGVWLEFSNISDIYLRADSGTQLVFGGAV